VHVQAASLALFAQLFRNALRDEYNRYSIAPETVAKWRKRPTMADASLGPKPASTVLTAEEEAIAVAFRQHTLLPLEDCLYAVQETSAHLSRSALHRWLKRHGVSRLPLNEEK